MKSLFVLSLLIVSSTVLAQQDYYDVNSGNGKGLRFWNGNNLYKISMGNGSQWKYGPVQDYSIKMHMSNTATRGWTWGVHGQTPIAALSTTGIFQLAGDFYSLGKVGIGTTNPETNLHVEGSSERWIYVNPGTRGGIRLGTSDDSRLNALYRDVSTDLLTLRSGMDHGELAFIVGGDAAERMRISSDGNVGIGTSSPSSLLHVSSSTSGDAVLKIEADTDNNNENDNSWIELKQDGGGLGAYIGFNGDWGGGGGSQGAEPDNLFRIGTRYSGVDNFSRFVINGYNGNVGIGSSNPDAKLHVFGSNAGDGNPLASIMIGKSNGAEIEAVQEGNDDDRHSLAFRVKQSQTAADPNFEAMRIKFDGLVGIGTTTPDEMLTVAGNIKAKLVKVRMDAGSVPDYVFAEDYNLRSLDEIEKYIKSNSHLPEIPSAKEIEENNLDLGEMNMLLLKKIEELTLYTLEQESKLKDQSKEIQNLKSNNGELSGQLEANNLKLEALLIRFEKLEKNQ